MCMYVYIYIEYNLHKSFYSFSLCFQHATRPEWRYLGMSFSSIKYTIMSHLSTDSRLTLGDHSIHANSSGFVLITLPPMMYIDPLFTASMKHTKQCARFHVECYPQQDIQYIIRRTVKTIMCKMTTWVVFTRFLLTLLIHMMHLHISNAGLSVY